jgi:hypothetical protein
MKILIEMNSKRNKKSGGKRPPTEEEKQESLKILSKELLK